MKKSITRLAFCLLVSVFILTACSGGVAPTVEPTAAPTTAPTVPASMSEATEDRVRVEMASEFLANLPEGFGLVDAQTLSTTSALILDVRSADEFSSGHIEGSINIPLPELTAHLDALPNLDQEIVVVCGIGHRGAIGMTLLQMLGYHNVRSLKGGLAAWKEAGLPVVEGAAEALETGAAPAIDPDRLTIVADYLDNVLPDDFGLVDAEGMQAFITNPSTILPPAVVNVGEPVVLSGEEIEKFVDLPLEKLAENLEAIPFEQDKSRG